MRIKIFKKIDYSEIDAQLNIARSIMEEPFLIMSKDTANAFMENASYYWDIHQLAFKEGEKIYDSYKGIPVALCELVPYGEVEIR